VVESAFIRTLAEARDAAAARMAPLSEAVQALLAG
jgi:hypothetical protein